MKWRHPEEVSDLSDGGRSGFYLFRFQVVKGPFQPCN